MSQTVQKLYEDNVSGKVSDEWFLQLANRYETERMDLKAKIASIRDELSAMGTAQKGRDVCFFHRHSLYYRVVVIRVPLQGLVLHCKGCCGLVFFSYRKTVLERLQPQSFAVLLIS